MAERLEKPSGGPPRSDRTEKVQKTPDPRPHYVELDALRGIGVLGIVVAHALQPWYRRVQEPLTIPLLNIDLLAFFHLSLGPFCLGLFFLISGYLLAWTEGSRASRGDYSLRSYALRRALRMLPAYYVALAVVFVLWPSDPTLTDTLLHLAVLQTFWPSYADSAYDPAFWYLTSEVVFYVTLPLLVLKIRGLYPRLALFGVLVAVSLAANVYENLNAEALLSGDDSYGHYLLSLPLRHLWLFVAGVLIRTLVERLHSGRVPWSPHPVATFILFAVPLALLPIFPYLPFVGLLVDPRLFTVWLAIPFFAAGVLGSPVLSRVLSWRLLAFVGMISYSLYLLHETVLMLVRVYLWRSAKPLFTLVAQLDGAALWLALAGYLGAVLVVSGAVAYLSFRYVESPFLRYKPK